MEPVRLISQYIAPWALAKEEIPLHLIWEPIFEYDEIELLIPEDIVLKEFYNVDSYTEYEEKIVVENLKTPNFFGLSVASKDILKNMHVKRKIVINFIRNNEVIYSTSCTANIFRPFLNVLEVPDSITIYDKQRNNIDITLELSGFGHIQIENQISTGGKFDTQPEPLYREFVRRMISTFGEEEVEVNDKGIKIDSIYLQNKAKEYIDKINKGQFPLDFEKEDLEDFKSWLTDDSNRDKVMSVITRQLENILVNSLLFYFEQHPEINVSIPQGNPTVTIDRVTRIIRIRIKYKDFMLNEYEPIELSIKIDDKREDKTQQLDIPINLNFKLNIINPIEECGKV